MRARRKQVVAGMNLPTSTYSVLYYPWVEVSNPDYDPNLDPPDPAVPIH